MAGVLCKLEIDFILKSFILSSLSSNIFRFDACKWIIDEVANAGNSDDNHRGNDGGSSE